MFFFALYAFVIVGVVGRAAVILEKQLYTLRNETSFASKQYKLSFADLHSKK